MQDFDFAEILPEIVKFTQIYLNFTQICSNFAQICPKNFVRGCGRIPASSVPTPLVSFKIKLSPGECNQQCYQNGLYP